MADHLTGGEVERFARGGLARAKARELLRHLLQGCKTCGERLRPLLEPEPADDAEGSGSEYDAPITRAVATARTGKPQMRQGDWARVEWGLRLLRSRPGGVQGLTDEEAEELRGAPMVEVLAQLSFEERYRDPQKMLALAEFARVAAENLDPRLYDPEVIADHQARAWSELANAYRVNDDLGRANWAQATAEDRRLQGTGNLFLLARVADLRASLLNTQRLIPDACELLDGVFQLYLKLGDNHLAGRALVKKGIYTDYEGDPAGALRLLREGLALLDRERDLQLLTSATENVLELMVRSGELREAAKVLLKSGLRQALAGQPLSLLKLRGVEGQILAGLGKPQRAEAAFLEARAGFLEHNKGYNAALAGLDLAAVWLEQGKAAQVKELAQDMLATFRKLGIQREALRAMDCLKRACEQEAATPDLARQVGRFLRRLEREPQLRFEAV